MNEDRKIALEQAFEAMPIGGVHTVEFGGHYFDVVKTRLDGMHSGRSRFFVACVKCEKLMHSATTGPVDRIEQHLDEIARGVVDSKLADAFELGQLRVKAQEPIPMRLVCPECAELHVDEALAGKPHHTHACQHCGNVWRPALVNTVGVRFLPGYKDEAPKT